MNPQNGEIYAMSDSLVYDLNNPRDLSLYYSEEETESFNENEKLEKLNEIWQNYCLTYTYEPGSTAKPFTVATAFWGFMTMTPVCLLPGPSVTPSLYFS